MEHLRQRLADRKTREAYENYLHQLLRLGEASKLDGLISQGFKLYPSEFSSICLKIMPSSIHLSGWDELIADMAHIESKDEHITAIGIDIIGGSFDSLTPELETSYYNDVTYAFSKKTFSEISSEYTTDIRPWEDGFVNCAYNLEVSGFCKIIEELSKYNLRNHDYQALYLKGDTPDDYPGKFLAEWFIYLHFYRALKRQLELTGLPRSIPVIFGQNDFGSHVGVILEYKKTTNNENRTEEILRGRARVGVQKSKAQLEQNIEHLRLDRHCAKSLPRRLFRNKIQKKTGDYIIKSFKQTMDMHNMNIPKPLDKMTDEQFETIMFEYQKKWLSKT